MGAGRHDGIRFHRSACGDVSPPVTREMSFWIAATLKTRWVLGDADSPV